jgi:hypothetical protein
MAKHVHLVGARTQIRAHLRRRSKRRRNLAFHAPFNYGRVTRLPVPRHLVVDHLDDNGLNNQRRKPRSDNPRREHPQIPRTTRSATIATLKPPARMTRRLDPFLIFAFYRLSEVHIVADVPPLFTAPENLHCARASRSHCHLHRKREETAAHRKSNQSRDDPCAVGFRKL